jgi:hypothetical protein
MAKRRPYRIFRTDVTASWPTGKAVCLTTVATPEAGRLWIRERLIARPDLLLSLRLGRELIATSAAPHSLRG